MLLRWNFVLRTRAFSHGRTCPTRSPGRSGKPEPRKRQHVGSAVAYMASLPLDANVLFMTVMATKMPFVGRG